MKIPSLTLACTALLLSGLGSAAVAQSPMNAGSTALPLIKSGYWHVLTQSDGMNVNSTMCLDEAIQKEMSVLGQNMMVGSCTAPKINGSNASGWKTASVCDMGMGKMTIDGLLTGDYKTAYKQETTITSMVSGQKQVARHVTQGTYKGACPAGMKAGDITMDGGLRMNLRELAKMGEAMAAGRK